MKVLLFCLFTLILCLSAKKRHLVRQDEQTTCGTGCLECDQGDQSCKQCAESFILNNYGYCVNTVCPEGRFFNSELVFCDRCSYGCAKCNSTEQCLACNETMGQP